MLSNNNPRIEIHKDEVDKIVIGITWIALLILCVLPIYYYDQLPDKIGLAEKLADKSHLFILSGIGALMFLFLKAIIKYPHIYNYLVKITTENARAQYTNATKMIRWVNCITTSMLAYITFGTIMSALGKMNSMGIGNSVVFIVILLGCIGHFTIQSFKIK